MDGVRTSLVLPGRDAGELRDIARWADEWNIGGLWVGDPRAAAPNSDDSYVTTTAAALAAVTDSLRLGVLLTLRGSAYPERAAEDVGVVDQMSAGRLELGLVAPADDVEAWAGVATNVLRAWNEWPMSDGDAVPAIPQPAQPVIPRIVVGPAELAERLSGGRMVFADDPQAVGRASDSGVRGRVVLVCDLDLPDGVIGWLRDDPLGRVKELKETAGAAGATEIALTIAPDQMLGEADVKALGIVAVPGLRAYWRQAETVVGDAWRWLTEKADLHDAPQDDALGA